LAAVVCAHEGGGVRGGAGVDPFDGLPHEVGDQHRHDHREARQRPRRPQAALVGPEESEQTVEGGHSCAVNDYLTAMAWCPASTLASCPPKRDGLRVRPRPPACATPVATSARGATPAARPSRCPPARGRIPFTRALP